MGGGTVIKRLQDKGQPLGARSTSSLTGTPQTPPKKTQTDPAVSLLSLASCFFCLLSRAFSHVRGPDSGRAARDAPLPNFTAIRSPPNPITEVSLAVIPSPVPRRLLTSDDPTALNDERADGVGTSGLGLEHVIPTPADIANRVSS